VIDIETIDHLQVLAPTGSEAAVRAFYGETLGLVEVEKPPELKARGGVWYKIGPGAVLLHIGVEENPPDAGRRHFAFRVRDVAGARQALEEAGVRTGDAPRVSGMPRFYAWDPFGNQIEFMAYEGARSYKRFRTPARRAVAAPAEDEEE
jgi:catechol 2,3-dioxygenase-like lactoylglutathione lyase family enzyme